MHGSTFATVVRVVVALEVFDDDDPHFAQFRRDAEVGRDALLPTSRPIDGHESSRRTWADFEAAARHDGRIMIERHRLRQGEVSVDWWLGGAPGHHPGAILRVVLSRNGAPNE